MLTKDENDLLCRVEGEAPMGQLMRRHWTPVCLIEEVPDPDGTPVQARVFGEDLVVFRDTHGQVGVMDEYCPHWRASLVFGRNEDGGLRCLYHGWKMDVHGQVLEMVSEPAASSLAQKVRHRAFAVQEWGGFVWAYMGPPDKKPAPPEVEWSLLPESHRFVSRRLQECNYLQAMEGGIDTAQVS